MFVRFKSTTVSEYRMARTAEPRSPSASSPAVRARMQAVKQRDTAPELAIRRIVHATGLRYRVDVRPLPELRRKADLVFRRERVAVFVDGCFWHGCPQHYRTPQANSNWWDEKIEQTRARDQDTEERLGQRGWVSVRIWEHAPPEKAAEQVEAVVRGRRLDAG